MVPVRTGLALARRGHDVSVLANAHFEPLLSRVGLPFTPVGTVDDYPDDYRRAVEHRNQPTGALRRQQAAVKLSASDAGLPIRDAGECSRDIAESAAVVGTPWSAL